MDCTNKVHLASRAIARTLEQCDFAKVKLLTHETDRPYAVEIPKIESLNEYSRFICRELWRHVDTPHCMIVQADGYCLNGKAWTDAFKQYDYIGAPWLPANSVGNGGCSYRSRKLLEFLSTLAPNEFPHPCDAWICIHHRADLERAGLRIAPIQIARLWGFEGRSWNGTGQEWQGVPTHYRDQFTFHSWLTPLPEGIDRPLIAAHAGDAGDVIYSLAAMKALGGGGYFFSGDNKYPFPAPTRWQKDGAKPHWVDNLKPLLMAQDYIWFASYTHALPFSTDIDFNRFRQFYRTRQAANWESLFRLHQRAAGVEWPEDKPWLTVDQPKVIPGRPIVVSRTSRFQRDKFPWDKLVRRYGQQMVFVGSPLEAQVFQGFGAPKVAIPYEATSNLLELARVIAGAKVFIGNQSAPMAIALGLGQNVIQEVWAQNPNCRLKRHNAIYEATDKIPPEWLD